jgi:hypothetical protein
MDHLPGVPQERLRLTKQPLHLVIRYLRETFIEGADGAKIMRDVRAYKGVDLRSEATTSRKRRHGHRDEWRHLPVEIVMTLKCPSAQL